jgi:glycosyltransferase involved in cell wall biosynthesis
MSGRPSHVDIAIPTHAEGRYLTEAVESVLAQTHAGLTLTVVDNGSANGHARAVVDRYGVDSRIRYVATGGVPPHESWTRCLQTGSAPYVVLLPHDELLDPEFVERHVHALERHPDAAFAFSGCRIINGAGTVLETRRQGIRPGRHVPPSLVPRFYMENQVPSCSIVVRRSAYDAVGPRFLGEYRMAMDWEMWLRLAVRFPVVFLPEALSAGRVHDESWSAVARGWGDVHSSMIDRAEELIAEALPGYELPARVRARRRGRVLLETAWEHLEAGDWRAARQALHAALEADARLLAHPQTTALLAGCAQAPHVREAVVRARTIKRSLRIRAHTAALIHAAVALVAVGDASGFSSGHWHE